MKMRRPPPPPSFVVGKRAEGSLDPPQDDAERLEDGAAVGGWELEKLKATFFVEPAKGAKGIARRALEARLARERALLLEAQLRSLQELQYVPAADAPVRRPIASRVSTAADRRMLCRRRARRLSSRRS